MNRIEIIGTKCPECGPLPREATECPGCDQDPLHRLRVTTTNRRSAIVNAYHSEIEAVRRMTL